MILCQLLINGNMIIIIIHIGTETYTIKCYTNNTHMYTMIHNFPRYSMFLYYMNIYYIKI